MTLVYARKVNQQCLYVQKLVDQATEAEGASVAALTQASYLQLELAVRLYVLELAANTTMEYVSPASLTHAYDQAPTAELAELVDLAKRPETWLARFLWQIHTLRSGEAQGKLRGSIFQLEESDGQNLISARNLSNLAEAANLEDLQSALSEFKHLVERQREVRTEY